MVKVGRGRGRGYSVICNDNPMRDEKMINLRGKFIVLDGNEGCGKSTQSEMLRAALASAGLDVLAVRDPGSTRIGEQIRAVLLNPDHAEMSMRCEMLLYMAARAQMMAELILPALDSGKTVVCDRFVSSTLAYQLGGDGLTAGEIRATADVAIRGRWPDLTILLDMPPDKSLARVKRAKDRIEQRPLEYHEQVRRNYLAQAEADRVHYRLISADRSREEVHQDILRAVTSLATTARSPA
ncbi:MAG: tmk [Phycisphaerales bacterium]|nr:tmk [Phycisphaerales bacterium]